jgi:hypothetical protein
MNKNRLYLGISIVSLLLMSLAVFNPFIGRSRVNKEAASDFYQRHPDWIWTANHQNVMIPVTGEAVFSDYFQRHPELSNLKGPGQGASDYAERHPELSAAAANPVDTTDYYFRHPELSVSAAQNSIDLTDYYFRHLQQ